MDNKIIIELIKKDLEELKLLVEAIESKPGDSEILINICRSKANSLVQEIDLLNHGNDSQSAIAANQHEIEEPVDNSDEMKPDEIEETVHSFDSIHSEAMEAEKKLVPDEGMTEETIEVTRAELHVEEEKELEPISETVSLKNNSEAQMHVEPEVEQTDEVNTQPEEGEEAAIESKSDEKPVETKSGNSYDKNHNRVLGEKFTSEPSLNERFANLAQKQSKFSPKPISNLKKAIGINDRFLYTRELFENNMGKFEETVDTIDNSGGLVEAINFLEQNFRWQKNEVSLKFIDLVKRRFDN